MITFVAACAIMQAPAPYVPDQTTVAVIPTVNVSGDKFKNMVKSQEEHGDDRLRFLFEDRGFIVIPKPKMDEIIKASGVDMTDEENQKREVLYDLGKRAGAQLVVFAVINDTIQKRTRDWFSGERMEGFANVKIWLLDVTAHTPIISGKTYNGTSSGGRRTGSLEQVNAVKLSIDNSLKEFLKPYKPMAKKN